ncbi:MAG: bifunctional riboflavin kinase/FAD synthetase [Planctomycetes bacterium]|nr:bifunctional riboflavin kinase/FAD synthetase [Planctomycetota bacterium]
MKKAIITWGIFDGMHRGHQQLINKVVVWAKKARGTPLVLTFYEHPDKVLLDKQPPTLTSLEHRFSLLRNSGIKEIIALPFASGLRNLSPEAFVRDILLNWLNIFGLVVTSNLRFGKDKQGNLALLKKLCKKYHLNLKTIQPVYYKDKIISSTRIRQAISQGNLREAKAMLGRPITLMGTVVTGSGRGRKLGIPTANLDLHHEIAPPNGVYTGRARVNGHYLKALTNIGTRPTFDKGKKVIVEVHIIGLKSYNNLYGKTVELELIRKIRGEKKFRNAAELLRQIEKDKKYCSK